LCLEGRNGRPLGLQVAVQCFNLLLSGDDARFEQLRLHVPGNGIKVLISQDAEVVPVSVRADAARISAVAARRASRRVAPHAAPCGVRGAGENIRDVEGVRGVVQRGLVSITAAYSLVVSSRHPR
jgi:hypothetical protein